jgi:hypothetical protein
MDDVSAHQLAHGLIPTDLAVGLAVVQGFERPAIVVQIRGDECHGNRTNTHTYVLDESAAMDLTAWLVEGVSTSLARAALWDGETLPD